MVRQTILVRNAGQKDSRNKPRDGHTFTPNNRGGRGARWSRGGRNGRGGRTSANSAATTDTVTAGLTLQPIEQFSKMLPSSSRTRNGFGDTEADEEIG